MRRVLHLIYSLDRGGAETQLTYLSGGLVRVGWEVHVGYMSAGLSGEPNVTAMTEQGVHLQPLPIRNRFNPLALPATLGVIRRIDPAIVQTWLPVMDLIGGSAARIAGRPWILSERNNSAPHESVGQMRLRARLARGADAIVANSESALPYWQDRLRPETPRRVVRNALPHSEIERVEPADRSELGIARDQRLVLFAGRFEPQKNIENLLLALERVTQDARNIAMLCGRGPLQKSIEDFIRTRGLQERILMPGFREDLWRWIKTADLALSVSRFEGMPNVAAETMALGCPIILSDIGPHREIADAAGTDFVPCDDPEVIAQTTMRLLDDPDRRARMAKRNLERARAWSIDAAAQAYDSLYDEVSR